MVIDLTPASAARGTDETVEVPDSCEYAADLRRGAGSLARVYRT